MCYGQNVLVDTDSALAGLKDSTVASSNRQLRAALFFDYVLGFLVVDRGSSLNQDSRRMDSIPLDKRNKP
jgi:hypothetical protein